jgi:UDP-N-acetylmuramoyl-tripeptide--D-alanyl-D-alanine ligase
VTLWSSTDVETATGGFATTNWSATGISIDTRTIQVGELFVALKDQRDGHNFVATALANGASAALVSRVPDGVDKNAPLLIVPDVLAALQDMAQFARARTSAVVIGVTGSVGKTSTKEMLKMILSISGKVHVAEKSFNNHWGVPLTLARMPINANFAVIEIGMNSPGEIRPLAKLANLDIAMVLNVSAVHLKSFKNVQEIAYAKSEIFENLSSKATAIVNNDLPSTPVMMKIIKKVEAKIITFGHAIDSDYRLIETDRQDTKTISHVMINGINTTFNFHAEGNHFAMNALAAIAAAQVAGGSLSEIIQALSDWEAPAGRGERKSIKYGSGCIELIDESYNANPASMAAALEVLANSEALGSKIAILGEMGELGSEELSYHVDLASLDVITNIDIFHLVGPMMQSMYEALPIEKRGLWVETTDELVLQIRSLLSVNDIVMVKGSNYTRVSKIVEVIKKLDA